MLKPTLTSPGALLRAEMDKGAVILPGVFNALSALSAAAAGARGLYLSGAGITNANLGVPDIALATMTEFAQQAAYVCGVAPVPVISDADTGFGEAHNVARAVIELERAGLAGIHLEDQASPKRCGHLDGKSLISAEHAAAKLRAAGDARKDPSFLLVARTDARAVEGLGAAIERAKAYADAGADVLFPEGLESEAEFEAFRAALATPLLANMTEFGKTPLISAARFEELGYSLVIFPMTALRAALKTLDDTYAELLRTGTQAALMPALRTRKELYARLEYPDYEAQDARWASGASNER